MNTHAHTCTTCDGTGRLSVRPFVAHWTDEDRGPQSVAVLAMDIFAARDIIERLTGQVCEVKSL